MYAICFHNRLLGEVAGMFDVDVKRLPSLVNKPEGAMTWTDVSTAIITNICADYISVHANIVNVRDENGK